jgi:predicted glutamine amidotransferase
MVKGKRDFLIEEFLFSFSQKCKDNKEWQGDGWGICWLNSKGEWEIFKSLSSIWEDEVKFKNFPKSKVFLIHARSSTFEKDKGKIEFNQPFFNKGIAFVFNGEIKRVKGIEVPGEIGSQKIFNLFLKEYSNSEKVEAAIEKIKKLLEENSEKIVALNIGICDKKNLFVLCYFSTRKDYYTLYYSLGEISLVSSEKISNLKFFSMENGQILVL